MIFATATHIAVAAPVKNAPPIAQNSGDAASKAALPMESRTKAATGLSIVTALARTPVPAMM
jgi:hypothetical protein